MEDKILILNILIWSFCSVSYCNIENKMWFINATLSWRDASKYCKSENAVLASNSSTILAMIGSNADTIKSNINDLWLGSYTVLTKWAYIKGCYEININMHEVNGYGEMFYCQKLCERHNYYAYPVNPTESYCFCLDVIPWTKEENCFCNNNACTYIFEYNREQREADASLNCLYVSKCKGGKVERGVENCSIDYKVICDNEVSLDYMFTYGNYTNAANECRKNGSFIKWYEKSDNLCDFQFNHWTSGRRGLVQLSLQVPDDIDNVDDKLLVKCSRLTKDNNTSFHEWSDYCDSSYSFPFFCENEPNVSITTVISTTKEPHLSTPKTTTTVLSTNDGHTEHSASSQATGISAIDDHTIPSTFSQTTGGNRTESRPIQENSKTEQEAIIIGAVVPAIIIIVIVIVVLVLRHRKAQEHKKPINNSPYVYSNANPNELEQRPFSVANQSYDDMNDKPSNGTMLSPSNELAKDVNEIETGTKPVHNYALVNKIPENYDFAQPIANESDYAYNSDYDHLHKIIKTTQESEYALTCPEIKYVRDSNTYDTFASSNASDGQQAGSEYDHLPTKIDNDPTYDCAALKSRKHEETNYDSFSR